MAKRKNARRVVARLFPPGVETEAVNTQHASVRRGWPRGSSGSESTTLHLSPPPCPTLLSSWSKPLVEMQPRPRPAETPGGRPKARCWPGKNGRDLLWGSTPPKASSPCSPCQGQRARRVLAASHHEPSPGTIREMPVHSVLLFLRRDRRV